MNKVKETIASIGITVDNLQTDTKVRDILTKEGYGNQAIDEALELLDGIATVLKTTPYGKCTCQGFHVPYDCPIHGRNK